MLQHCDKNICSILNRFYDNYEAEVIHHFNYEETTIFPYIQHLAGQKTTDPYEFNIRQFEDNHTNIDEKLTDLKNIIIKYIPEECSNSIMFEVLYNICRIERDLKKHSIVENKLLIPLVCKLENNG